MAATMKLLVGALALTTSHHVSAMPHEVPVDLEVLQNDDNLISRTDTPTLQPLRNSHEVRSVPDGKPMVQFEPDAHILQPLRPSHHHKQARRSLGSAFDILGEDTLYWQDIDGTTAEFHINTSGESEGIINLEYFDDLVNSIVCPTSNSTGPLAIAFSDKLDFDTAAEVWAWLTDETDNHLLVMVGAGDCGWNDDRILYRVESLTFSDQAETAFLDAKPVAWKDSIPTYELYIGKSASQHATKNGFQSHEQKRGIEFNPDFSVPFEFDVSGKSIDFDMDNVEFMGKCENCSVRGQFDFEAKFAIGSNPEAWLQVSTPGVAITAILNTTISGELKSEMLEQQLKLAEYNPYGIHIPGIVSIGPSCKVALRAGVTAINGTASMVFGGTVQLVPSYARLDFLNSNRTGQAGWEFEFIEHPLEVEASVEVTAIAALSPGVGVEVSALMQGFTADISADTPRVTAELRGIWSTTCQACGKYESGLEGTLAFGAGITAALKRRSFGSYTTLWSLPILNFTMPPFLDFCIPLGINLSGNCQGNNYPELPGGPGYGDLPSYPNPSYPQPGTPSKDMPMPGLIGAPTNDRPEPTGYPQPGDPQNNYSQPGYGQPCDCGKYHDDPNYHDVPKKPELPEKEEDKEEKPCDKDKQQANGPNGPSDGKLQPVIVPHPHLPGNGTRPIIAPPHHHHVHGDAHAKPPKSVGAFQPAEPFRPAKPVVSEEPIPVKFVKSSKPSE